MIRWSWLLLGHPQGGSGSGGLLKALDLSDGVNVRVHSGTAQAKDAELYYEVRGDGPPLLLIQGGLGEAGATEQLAERLAARYAVISYDRRGLSRSASGTGGPSTMAMHGDDAAALLAQTAPGPAVVAGASIGALIGLHLAVQHPALVATLIAHEPPMAALVPDPEQEAELDKVAELARDDVVAAIQYMGALTSGGQAETEEGAQPGKPVGDLVVNLRRFFTSDFDAVRGSTLDSTQIAAVPQSTRIIPTGGAKSRGGWEYRCAEKLAQDLGRALIELPGGHNGLVSHPRAVATELQRLLAEV